MNDFDDTRAHRSRVAEPAGRGLQSLLERGDRVGVVATGFAVRPDILETGLARLSKMGFVPVPGANVTAIDDYLAGDDAARIADLNHALRDRSLRAIWFARGGYGTARLLEHIDWTAMRRHPKVLIGFSDLTALYADAQRRGAVCLHGPMIANLASPGAWHQGSLRAALAARPQTVRIAKSAILSPGRASGELIGGNLTVLAHLLGTSHAPRFERRVLFLEETGEEAYRVDRVLTHLRQSGALDRVAAIVLGWFDVPATPREFPGDREIAEVLRDRLGSLGIPVVAGIPSGHRNGKWTLPMGGITTVDTARRTVVFEPRRPGSRR